MIALIVIGVIVGLLLLLLFLPIAVDLEYDKDLLFKIKYFGIVLFKQPQNKFVKAGKKAKEKSEKKPPEKDNFLKTTYKKKGLLGTINYFSDIFTIVFKKIWWVIKRFKFKQFKLNLIVATTDAADTAIQYGKICAAVYPILSLLHSITDFKSKEINISADFDKSQSEFKISVLIKTPLLFCLIAAIGFLIQFLKLQRKESEKYERKQSKNRNGHNHGQAPHNG